MRGREFTELQAFALVAEEGSFTRAALRLQLAPSTLSQIIRELEERLGVRLLERTTRSVSLSGAGLRLLSRLQPALEQMSTAVQDAKEQRDTPRGRVRMHAPRASYNSFVKPALLHLQQRYPEVSLDLVVSDEMVHLMPAGFDLCICLSDFVNPSLAHVDLGGPLQHAVVASPEYFNAWNPPQHPRDLLQHRCIGWRQPGKEVRYPWRFHVDQQWIEIATAGGLTVSHCDVAVGAAELGLGIAFVLASWAQEQINRGQLVSVLESYLPSFPGWSLCYSARNPVPAATMAVVNLLANRECSHQA